MPSHHLSALLSHSAADCIAWYASQPIIGAVGLTCDARRAGLEGVTRACLERVLDMTAPFTHTFRPLYMVRERAGSADPEAPFALLPGGCAPGPCACCASWLRQPQLCPGVRSARRALPGHMRHKRSVLVLRRVILLKVRERRWAAEP